MIELILLAILLYGAFRGWKNGLVKEVISFVSIFLGFCVAYELYRHIHVNLLQFLLIWLAVPVALSAVAWMVTQLFDHIVVVGTLNRLLGAAAGFLKFAFLLGCVIMVVDYVREAKTKFEDNPVVKTLEAVPNMLFPDVNKDVDNGGEERQ